MDDLNDLMPGPGGSPDDPTAPQASQISDAAGPNGLATGTPQDMQDAAAVMPTGAGPQMPTPGGDGTDADASGDDSVKATPEEQHQYNQMVTRAKQFIHGQKSRDAVLKMLNVQGQPAFENVGRATASIVQMLETTAEKSGAPLGQDVLFHGGMAIAQDLLNLGIKSGSFGKVKPDQQPHLLQLSVLAAMKHYGNAQIQGGTAQTADAQGMMASLVGQDHASGNGTPATQSLITAGVRAALAAKAPPAPAQQAVGT